LRKTGKKVHRRKEGPEVEHLKKIYGKKGGGDLCQKDLTKKKVGIWRHASELRTDE